MPLFSEIITVFLITGGIFYFLFCLVSYLGLFAPGRVLSSVTPFVSVIVAARNEEESIGLLLDDLIAQDYPIDSCEYIVVDDDSGDSTSAILARYAEKDGRIRPASTIHSSSPYSHKKKAVHEGIMRSRGDIIMTVDADCRVPAGWIKGMVSYFAHGIDFVAGEVSIDGGGWIADLETLEFIGIQSVSAGCANIGFPITCNGANLAYRRTAFDSVGGFEGVGHIVSGDDDLIMQKIANKNPNGVIYALSTRLAVHVQPVRSVKEFLEKRTRWVSKIGEYPSKSALALLSVLFLFLVSIPFSVLCVLSGWIMFQPLACALLLKAAGDFLPVAHGAIRHGKTRLLWLFPLAEFLHIPYIIPVTIKGCFGSFVWHGRHTTGRRDSRIRP